MKKILITGANGFIAKNLIFRLKESKLFELYLFTRNNTLNDLNKYISDSDIIIHLAGVNRSPEKSDFIDSNHNLTAAIASQVEKKIKDTGKRTTIIFTSSIHAGSNNIYGETKLSAEKILGELNVRLQTPVHIIRLQNVFGKWCRPNYNSFVSTFCFNVINNIPIVINDPDAEVSLVYIDDVINRLYKIICNDEINQYEGIEYFNDIPIYKTKVGHVAHLINEFGKSRDTLILNNVGEGLERALYATFVSYYSTDSFSYSVNKNEDERGSFVEILRTKANGQFSYFTAKPGITRGGHYHHTKTEKFLVVHGVAMFRFQNISTGEFLEKIVTANSNEIIETVPGWAHDVTNIGDENLIVMLWANELFDPLNPDTVYYSINQ